MFALTLRFRSFLPQRDEGAALPAGLALLLLLVIPLQLWAGVETVTPTATPGSVRIARAAPPAVGVVVAPPVILARNIFQAPAVQPNGAPVATAALGGATVAGSVAVRGRRVAMIVLPGGRTAYLAPGRSLQGWTLVGLDTEGARFARDGKTLTVAFGAAAGAPTADPAEPDAE